jgi:hypothetical protein
MQISDIATGLSVGYMYLNTVTSDYEAGNLAVTPQRSLEICGKHVKSFFPPFPSVRQFSRCCGMWLPAVALISVMINRGYYSSFKSETSADSPPADQPVRSRS